MDKKGNLYGTANQGGSSGLGSVFKIDRAGKETVLHNFTNPSDGAGLVMDNEGNLYGTTLLNSSYGFGTVFKLDRTGKETVLHNFTNTPDGAIPSAGLVIDKEGNFYGTTDQGGSYGYGTVFKLILNCDRNVESHPCDEHSEQ
jgi:uncharacterized repeat protein (TIGR03803 family)